jgi:aspartate dehydrogenase
MTPTRIAIAGLGSIGKALAATLDADGIPGLRLTAVSARDLDRARLAVAGVVGSDSETAGQ